MEGSHSEAVFDSLNLNPQLFINEVFNTTEGLIDEAFESYKQESLNLVGNAGDDTSQKLDLGVSAMHQMVQGVLDKQLGGWEKYCLQHIFTVPDGFSYPRSEISNHQLFLEDVGSSDELDKQLSSLRERLVAAGKESTVLRRKLSALETNYTKSSSHSEAIRDVLEQFGQNTVNNMFQEMVKSARLLRGRVLELEKQRKKEIEQSRTQRMSNPNGHLPLMDENGFHVTLADLQDFMDDSDATRL